MKRLEIPARLSNTQCADLVSELNDQHKGRLAKFSGSRVGYRADRNQLMCQYSVPVAGSGEGSLAGELLLPRPGKKPHLGLDILSGMGPSRKRGPTWMAGASGAFP